MKYINKQSLLVSKKWDKLGHSKNYYQFHLINLKNALSCNIYLESFLRFCLKQKDETISDKLSFRGDDKEKSFHEILEKKCKGKKT
ncbi:MAG: hypothetical protein ACTSYC_03960 [Promethearchaeota archaeon]